MDVDACIEQVCIEQAEAADVADAPQEQLW